MSWEFAKTEDRTNSGANVQAFETFDEDGSIIREIIQNSLDAKRDECDNVIVEIEIAKRNTLDFPGREELLRSLQACHERFIDNDTKTTGKVETMIDSFKVSQHYVVTFRDLNTNGLIGGLKDGCEGTNLFQLIYGDGTTNKNTEKSSGGSFGIGKNAPFTRSQIKSIFYETYNIENEKHIVGKSILTSHKIENERRSQRGYYVDDGKIEKYLGDLGMKGRYGTAVHIPFYCLKNNKIESETEILVRDVLLNFMIAIDRNKLEVRFKNADTNEELIINKGTYSNYILKGLVGKKTDQRLIRIKAMHNLLNHANSAKYKLYMDDAESENYIELYVTLNAASTGFKRYFNLREQLMLIEDKKISGKNFKYDALAIYHGTKLNNILRDTEPPEHNSWKRNRLKDNKEKDYFRKAKNLVENKLIELFGEVTSEQIVLKEFNNDIFSENKNYEDVYTIKKITEKRIPKTKGKSEEKELADIFGRELKSKSRKKADDKAIPNSSGNAETTVVLHTNVTKKIRSKGDGLYKIKLIDTFDPQSHNIRVISKTESGTDEVIKDFQVTSNDGQNIDIKLNDVDLDISVIIEELHETK